MPWSWKHQPRDRKIKEDQQRKYTEQIAYELSENRQLLSKKGDSDKDWEQAEKIVRNPIRTMLFASNRPFIQLKNPATQALKFIAWETPKWFLFSLPKLEWMKLLAVPLVIAAAGSIISGQIQRENTQNRALQAYFDQLDTLTFERNLLAELPEKPDTGAIVLARGRTVAALRELDHQRREQLIAFLQASNLSKFTDAEPEREPVISFRFQNLSAMNLRHIDLSNVDFQGTNLREANLAGADLSYANLAGADLKDTNLAGAFLASANLARAEMWDANLEGAFLGDANLAEAELWGAYLAGAHLWDANLEGAELWGAHLAEADLRDANLAGAYLWGAHLAGARGLTEYQLTEAKLCRTTLPDDFTLDPNRNCAEVGVDPEM